MTSLARDARDRAALLAAHNDFPRLPVARVTAIAALGVIVRAVDAAWTTARRAAKVDPAITPRVQPRRR